MTLREAPRRPDRQGTCALCGEWASPAVVIGEVHSDAGPGWTQYAHPKCVRPRRRSRVVKAP